MSDQADLSAQELSPTDAFPEPVDDSLWRIEVDGYDRFREREFESLLTVANGRTGTRGSLEEGSPESSPATYVAGIYGRLPDDGLGPLPLIGPHWTSLVPRILGMIVKLDQGEILEHRRVLDLRQGILFRIWRQRLPSGKEMTFRSARFASLADRSVVALEARGYCNGLPLALAGDVPMPSLPYVEQAVLTQHGDRIQVELVARKGGRSMFAISTREAEGRLERIVGVSRTAPGGWTDGSAEASLRRADAEGFGMLRERHRGAWRERWREADVTVDGDPGAQASLRLALYHLISSGGPDSDLASIGARGLTGPGYDGHVFWDCDVFALPFFLHTQPAVARSLIRYRETERTGISLPISGRRGRGHFPRHWSWFASSGEEGRGSPPYQRAGT